MADRSAPSSPGGLGLEAVITAAAWRGVGGLLPLRALARTGGALAQNPSITVRCLGALASDVATLVAKGGDPAELDARFSDPVWRQNPLFQRLALAYLATSEAALGAVDDAPVDWRTRTRTRLAVDNILAALAPTNNVVTNPAAWKEVLDSGGRSLGRGVMNLVRDLHTTTKLPSSVDRDAFEYGVNIAATPGKVIHRERLLELIEYLPTTQDVDEVPLLMVASPVNKFYLLDLDPKQSIVAAHVAAGRRVFVTSFVQPDASHADAGLEAYVEALLSALDVVTEIAGHDRVHVLGLCGGGQLALMMAGYLAAIGEQERLATLTIGIAVADFKRAEFMAFLDEDTGAKAIRQATAHGCFRAEDSARSFALLRPVDGVWSSAVNNYVLGRKPPRIPLLYWAVDQTSMTVQFGTDLIRTAIGNLLAIPGGLHLLGQDIDLGQITVDTYIVGAATDHISPWEHCYRAVPLLGGHATFVLASGGHAVAIARPPGHQRSQHWTGEATWADPQEWLAHAQMNPGSWWSHWNSWIDERSPHKVKAPTSAGSLRFPPIADAPGEYVRVVLT